MLRWPLSRERRTSTDSRRAAYASSEARRLTAQAMNQDLPKRLRESAKACRALDRSGLLCEAAGEIEKLRARLLTDEDRELILFSANMIERDVAGVRGGKRGADARLYAKGLRRILKWAK